jgi:competence protein ComEC
VTRTEHLMQPLWNRLVWALQMQRGHRLPHVAVALGTGIGLYFLLPAEPSVAMLTGLAAVAAGFAGLGYWGRHTVGGVAVVCAIICFGMVLAGVRTALVSAPVLTFRYYGPIEGRIIKIDRSGSDKVRLELDRVRLSRMGPDRTPARVRISLHGTEGVFLPAPGQRIMTTGHLSPPQGPVEPGGFDFQRHAFFDQLGALGYTRTPVLLAAPPATGSLWLDRLRDRLSKALMARIEGPAGGVAAAIGVGDRAGLDAPTLEALRVSNLAHLLAISGLHMGLLAGFVFMSVRGGLSLIGPIALRYPIKKWAALVALPAAAFYLALSGGSVATQRAFIQVTVMLIAILCDRRALTLRSVAIAAIIVMLWRPEAVLGPGFQMSFAATTALVVAFGALRGRMPRGPRVLAPVFAVLVSSIVAGAATAPISAAHFNQIGQYGVLANLLSVPVMGAVVMPLLVVAGLLAPVGLEALALWPMALGLKWILAVADFIANLDGAARLIPAPVPAVLPVMALGFLWMLAWQGRARWVGVAPVVLAVAFWIESPRPAVLIAEDGGLVGIVSGESRALSKPRGAGFVAENWLSHDGWPADQEGAAARWSNAMAAGVGLVHVHGRGSDIRAAEACAQGLVVVANTDLDLPKGCLGLTPRVLRTTGAISVASDGTVRTTREQQGARPWVPPARDIPPSLAALQYVLIKPTSLP